MPTTRAPKFGDEDKQLAAGLGLLEALVETQGEQRKAMEDAERAAAGRVDAFAGELNAFAAQLQQSKVAIEETRGAHPE